MLQPRQHHLLARLLNFTRQEHFIKDRVDLGSSISPTLSFPLQQSASYLVEVEHQIKFADITKELIKHLDEEMYRLQVRQLVIIRIHARAEEQARVSAVDDLGGATKFDEVGLVLLVSGGDEAVDFAFELDLFVVGVGRVPFG